MTGSRAGVRSRREGWARDVKVVVTERDVDLLLTLWVAGVLRTRDFLRLFFGSRATANDRLRKLACAGYLDCHTRDLTADNYYTLSARGRDLVLDHRDLLPDTFRWVRTLPAKLDHALAVTDVRLHLVLACRSGAYALERFLTDADLAAARHAALLDLIPDALVELRAKMSGEPHLFFLEVDRGTEAVTWLVRHKLAAYARHASLRTPLYGVRDPLVVLVVPGLRRAKNIARAMGAVHVEARVVFALAPLLNETNVLGAAYALPADLAGAPADLDAAVLFIRRLLP